MCDILGHFAVGFSDPLRDNGYNVGRLTRDSGLPANNHEPGSVSLNP